MKKEMGKTYVMGDIHGRIDRLKDVLNQVDFNYDNDTLIQLGDVVDRGHDSKGVVDILLTIKNLISIKGNHDDWFLKAIRTSVVESTWYQQGGKETLGSYGLLKIPNQPLAKMSTVPITHVHFFENQKLYHIDEQNRLFVHGGINPNISVKDHEDPTTFYWDRLLFGKVSHHGDLVTKDNFKEIFIGHTPTIFYDSETPIFKGSGRLINIDTGCCADNGKLTIMDVETKEYWQSK